MIPAKTVAVRDRPSSTDGRTSAARRRIAASFAMALLATGCDRQTAADPVLGDRGTDRAALGPAAPQSRARWAWRRRTSWSAT